MKTRAYWFPQFVVVILAAILSIAGCVGDNGGIADPVRNEETSQEEVDPGQLGSLVPPGPPTENMEEERSEDSVSIYRPSRDGYFRQPLVLPGSESATATDGFKKEISIIKRIWNSPLPQSNNGGYGKAFYLDLINKIPNDGAYSLYNVQTHLMNFLIMAADSNDKVLISDLSDIALAAYDQLRKANGSYPFKEEGPQPSNILSQVTWLDIDPQSRKNYENLNVTGQWLYFVSSLVNAATSIPHAERSPSMNQLLNLYPPLLKAMYARLIFAESDRGDPRFFGSDPFNPGDDGSYGYIGWLECAGSPRFNKHEYRVILTKLRNGYNTDQPWCNMVLDWDIQVMAGLVEYLAAHVREPLAIEFDSLNRPIYTEYINNVILLIKKQLVQPPLGITSGATVAGFLVKPGALKDFPSHRYAGYTGENQPPTLRDTAPVRDVADDTAHFARYSWVLRTLYLNKEITASNFPAESHLEGLANQLAYKVFNRNLNKPNFRNFMDGSNGWYRSFPEGNQPGIGPFSVGSAAVISSGYPLYAAYNSDLRRVVDRLYEIFMMADNPTNHSYIQLRNEYGYTWENCQYSSAQSAWSRSCHKRESILGLDPESNRSKELFMFLSAYVNIRKFGAETP